MDLSVAVVCEARSDQQTGCGLADRVLLEEVEWLEPEMLDHCRAWRGFKPSDTYLSWPDAGKKAKSLGMKAHGHFEGVPGAHDALATRRALWVLLESADPPNAVILLRDDDRDTQRREGMLQAIAESTIGVPIVMGLAHTKRECWVLAGFDPENKRERDRLGKLRKQLGFNPIDRAHRLTANKEHEVRHPKCVLKVLTDDDGQRQAKCWQDADLEVLKQRGQATGLTAYLDEVAEKLATLLGAVWPRKS